MFFAKTKQTHFAHLLPFLRLLHCVSCVCMCTASKTSISNIKYVLSSCISSSLWKACHWTLQQRRRVFLTRFCCSLSTCFFNLSRHFPKDFQPCSSSLYSRHYVIWAEKCVERLPRTGVVKCISRLYNDKNWDKFVIIVWNFLQMLKHYKSTLCLINKYDSTVPVYLLHRRGSIISRETRMRTTFYSCMNCSIHYIWLWRLIYLVSIPIIFILLYIKTSSLCMYLYFPSLLSVSHLYARVQAMQEILLHCRLNTVVKTQVFTGLYCSV